MSYGSHLGLNIGMVRARNNDDAYRDAGNCPFLRHEDLQEVGRAGTHETLRGRAPCQLSRSVSVVMVSTCSPNRFM
jgi:hypothetical protein